MTNLGCKKQIPIPIFPNEVKARAVTWPNPAVTRTLLDILSKFLLTVLPIFDFNALYTQKNV